MAKISDESILSNGLVEEATPNVDVPWLDPKIWSSRSQFPPQVGKSFVDFNAIVAPSEHGGNFKFWDTSWKCFARKPGLAPYSIPPTRVFMLSNDSSAYVRWADINRAGCLVFRRFLDSHTSAPSYSSQVHST